MTGPEHYRMAETLLLDTQMVGGTTTRDDGREVEVYDDGPEIANAIAAAQVHATLALAAAIAEPIAQSYDGPDDRTIPRAWSAAIS